MKKLLVFVLACLASTTMFAQFHYPLNTSGCAGSNTTMTCFLYIDHVVQDDIDGFEIGVFDIAEGLCRGRALSNTNPAIEHPFFQITIKGNEGFSYTFKIYNHNTEEELTLVPDLNEEITWGAGKKYGTIVTPYELNFTDPNAPAGLTKDIVPFTGEKDHYYLIASPVGAVDFDNVTNLLANEYDLYYFDQNPAIDEAGIGREWITQKGNEEFTQLEPGMGYLYANGGDGEHETVTLTFNGTAYETETNVEMLEMPLARTEGAEFAGWNLLGNPFSVPAFLSHDYYRMNEDGYDLITAATDEEGLPAMEGCFVVAEEEGENVTFSIANPNAKRARLSLNLSNGHGVIDRAVVRFGQGRRLPKFQLWNNSTKVYIPMDSKDYAVVTSEGMGEMPVNFKAAENGSYSLTLSSENVDFSYLHLIDNMTGADVDLLATPSYSFDALTTDYASRFRLVFATGSSVDGDSFGFVNAAGNLCIFGIEGEATLQVMDVTGRILGTETFSGSYEKRLNAAPGVYVMRLINGNEVKTQKIVVR